MQLKSLLKTRHFGKNDEFTKLIDEAKIITNVKKRKELYMKAQLIFEKEIPFVPIAHSIVVLPVLDFVKGFKIYPTAKKTFNKVWINR